MMADYSDWAWDSDGGSAAAKALLVFSSMVATIGIVVLLPQRLGVDLPFERGFCLVFDNARILAHFRIPALT